MRTKCSYDVHKTHGSVPGKISGSLTVEAAFVVPVVFLSLYLFLQLFVFLRIQADMQGSMNSVIRHLAEYGTIYSELDSMNAEQAEDWLAKFGVDTAIGKIAGQSYMGYLLRKEVSGKPWISFIRGGVDGIGTSGSLMFDDDGRLELVAEYEFSPSVGLLPMGSLHVIQKAAGKSFHGKNRAEHKTPAQEDEETEDPEEETVYVAENGTVFHTMAGCTYLKLVIQTVSPEAISSLRNENGEIYRQCTYCDYTPVGTEVYVTSYGNRYHTRISCGELKRTVRSMKRKEAEEAGLHICSKCAKKQEES